ncbi:hypothetical protein ABH922_001212 [Rhodococcus sp. 27YEA15]
MQHGHLAAGCAVAAIDHLTVNAPGLRPFDIDLIAIFPR